LALPVTGLIGQVEKPRLEDADFYFISGIGQLSSFCGQLTENGAFPIWVCLLPRSPTMERMKEITKAIVMATRIKSHRINQIVVATVSLGI
jgi:hypothetical protein